MSETITDLTAKRFRAKLERAIEKAHALGCPVLIKHAHTINEGFEMRGVHPGLEYWVNDLECGLRRLESQRAASR